MNLITVFQKFPDQQACIDHLEQIRWPMQACCPFCGSERTGRKNEKNRLGRWNCHKCTNSFNVLTKTVFQGTHIELQKWFLAIALMVDAKKSLSSYQLGRDLDLHPTTAWRMQQRIRSAMTSDEGKMLQGIIEAGRNLRRREAALQGQQQAWPWFPGQDLCCRGRPARRGSQSQGDQ